MRRIAAANSCWIDLFDANYFSGKLRRLSGPRKLKQLKGKSLIVGPDATVMLSIRREGKDSTIQLDPKRVIPDLGKSFQGSTIRAAVVCAK
jgi:hypothetical protein